MTTAAGDRPGHAATAPAWARDPRRAGGASLELMHAAQRALTDPVSALAIAADIHLEGDGARARAFADLTVSGCNAWRAFAEQRPRDRDVHDALAPLHPDRLITDRAAAAIDAVLTRAYASAWGLRHGAVWDQPGWIAVCPEVDPPPRRPPGGSPGGSRHACFDMHLNPRPTLGVPGDAARRQSVHTRFAIFDAANEPSPVDASDRAIDRVLPRERPAELPGHVQVIVHLSTSQVGLDEADGLVHAASADGLTLIAVDAPGGGTSHICADPARVLQRESQLEATVIESISAVLGRDISSQVMAVGDARRLLHNAPITPTHPAPRRPPPRALALPATEVGPYAHDGHR
jgi:hypothetical protein